MFLSDLSIKRPILITMFLVVFLIYGILSYRQLNLELTPDMSLPVITIQTIYPGTGPDVIETQITKKIEDAVSSISLIDKIQSYSLEGVSFVIVMFELEKNEDVASSEVKDKVDAILSDLPSDAELPIIQKFDPTAESVIDIVLVGTQSPVELYEYVDKRLKDRLSQIGGVSNIEITGGREREIHVELDNRTIFTNMISLPRLVQTLSAQNIDLPGGTFQNSSQEYSVRMKGEFNSLDALRNVEVSAGSDFKKLGEIARITDAGEDVRERVTYLNKLTGIRYENAILMNIFKRKDGNTVKIADALYESLAEIRQELPAGMSIEVVTDHSTFIRASVNDTLNTIILGIVLTSLVLLFFLHDIRSTIIIALSMPMSIIATFFFMKLSGFSMNLMSLMGLSTSVGTLVANSVVVIENIFRHRSEGNDRITAASKGTAEVLIAVLASTLTNVVVFFPIASMQSIVGQLFKEFGMTVVYATIFSLITSFTLTPMLASLILPEQHKKEFWISKKLDAIFDFISRLYRQVLVFLFAGKKRIVFMLGTAVLLLVGSLKIGAGIGFDFVPKMDEGDVTIKVELPTGYNLSETAALLETIEEKVREHKFTRHIVTTLGKISDMNSGVNVAVMNIKLIDILQRTQTNSEVAEELTQSLSGISNAVIRVAAEDPMGTGEEPIQFDLMGQDSDVLEAKKEEILKLIKDVDGLLNLDTSSRPGKPEVTLNPDRVKLKDAGLTVTDVAMTVRCAVDGLVSTMYREGGEEYDILITMNDKDVNTPEAIGRLPVVSPKGIFLVSQLADISYQNGYSKILHKDRFKSIRFEGRNATGVPMGNIVNEINARLSSVEFPPGYKISWGSMVEIMNDMIMDMLQTFILAVILTYMLLAATLESFTQPLLILGTVPLAFIGVFVGMAMAGLSMNVVSMMSIVMLVGIVVNNAILILDYTNILTRERGMDVREALLEACPAKLKAILMSNIAIILGMLPMAIGVGESGAEMRQPMGVVSIGGLVVSTALTLFVIPALYELTERKKKPAVA